MTFNTPMPKRMKTLTIVACFAILPFGDGQAQHPSPHSDTLRAVAVTIDDLPAVARGGLPGWQRVTNRLLDHLTTHDIPAVGFVNESKLEQPGEEKARIALLQQWVDARLELGNHTYGHISFHNTPLDSFEADVLRGEVVTRRLLGTHGMTPRYFRHPYLHTGPDDATKAAFARFLHEHGYTIAPVTIDNDEWIYAAAYRTAAGDSAMMQRVGEAYVRYMDEVFAFYEQLSKELLGYEIKQVLLLHANELNADYFGELAQMMTRRGYTFITLEEALRDEAYRLGDPYTGRHGLSWLQRWAIGRGEEPGDEPRVDRFVRELSGF